MARFSDLMGNDQPNVLRATGTTDATAEQPAARCGQRCEFGAAPCVSGATPCDGDDSTEASGGACNSLPFAEMGVIVRPGASENENGTAGIRTQNQRIMSPLL